MKPNNWKKLAGTFTAVLFALGLSAQTKYDGDKLLELLGKAIDSPEFGAVKSAYNMDMANETHYRSDQGIELILAANTVTEIQLYRNSTVYGQFTGDLPIRLSFGMTPSQIRSVLGKPTVAYNQSGYLEFEAGRLIYACSFENGKLNQLSVSLK